MTISWWSWWLMNQQLWLSDEDRQLVLRFSLINKYCGSFISFGKNWHAVLLLIVLKSIFFACRIKKNPALHYVWPTWIFYRKRNICFLVFTWVTPTWSFRWGIWTCRPQREKMGRRTWRKPRALPELGRPLSPEATVFCVPRACTPPLRPLLGSCWPRHKIVWWCWHLPTCWMALSL